MAVFDPRQISVLLNGVEISDWADGSSVITVEHAVDAGDYTMGADGSGVFITNPDQSITLTLLIKQHSEDNKWLDSKLKIQQNNIKAFTPLSLEIRDLVNDDLVTATGGYFTTRPSYIRGAGGHNPTTWVIKFDKGNINFEKGLGN